MKKKELPENPTLKNIREWRGITQEELGKRIGSTKQLVSLYEKRERDPSLSKAIAIARALNISLKTLAQSLGIPCHDIPDDISYRPKNPNEED